MQNFLGSKKIFNKTLFIIFVYLLLHLLIRVIFNESIQVDDREQLIYAQKLQWGYPMPQPPLYSWISYFFFKIFDAGLFALTLLKYLLIFATFFYIYSSSVLLSRSREWLPEFTTYSFLLMPSFAWHMHQGFTHTILLGLGIAMTIYYFILLEENPSIKNYILLGVSISVGILGKYSYIIFFLISLFALFSIKEYRKILISKYIFLSFAILIFITSPHLIWLTENWNSVFIQANNRLHINISNSGISDSLLKLIASGFGFISPLIFLIIFIKWNLTKKILRLPKEEFFIRFFYALLFFTFIFFLFFDIKEVKVRWLHPILMAFPFLILIFINSYGEITKTFKKISLATLLVFTMIILCVRILQNTIGPELGYYGRINIPIHSALKKIPENVISTISAIKTNDYNLGVHLFDAFTDKEIIINNVPFNSKPNNIKKCLYVFDIDGNADDSIRLKSNSMTKFKKIQVNKGEFTYELFYRVFENDTCK